MGRLGRGQGGGGTGVDVTANRDGGGLEVDTIAAVSTAPGVGAVALVRVSGAGAGRVLLALAPGLDALPEPRRATLVELRDPSDGSLLDRVIAVFHEGPASYTGEDVVELSCHGGWLVPALVLEACERAGARRADPGEFTRRAYLRGKLDLVQAEAVADLIEARSRALHRAALGQLERGLSDRVAGLRATLVDLEAVLAHHIDFPEEDDAPVPVEQITGRAEALAAQIQALLATAPEGELLREGALAVLAGRPNVGKSSLYNALIGEERAIVTEEPGTTRDALVTTVELGGFPFRLVDTAGLRESGERIERMGIEVTRRYLERADVVLLCVPAGEGVGEAEAAFLAGLAGVPVVVVETKADLAAAATSGSGATPAAAAEARIATRLRISTVTGEGLAGLRALLPELVYTAVVSASPDAPVLTRRRQREALAVAGAEVAGFARALADGLPAEVAATHLRTAETALEELLGVISVEDVLDAVFAQFCVGK
ncbi:MAG TPA: tRNA uridine-5-carboxymethylaminomethyl(34) synthesis GTPase MnmE [Longimicrobiales bacterium]|nr:tRNA uridine-5-carboxymethylaminomethyl(34) synthesis GTPase MnmE [Longimicrobiales bacterium]